MLQVVWHSFQAGAPVWTFLGRTFFGFFWVDTMHMPHNAKNSSAHQLCTCPTMHMPPKNVG